MSNIIIIGPGGDSCYAVRDGIRDEMNGHEVTSFSSSDTIGASSADVAIGFDSTLVRGEVVEGPQRIAELIREKLAKVIPIIVINTGNDRIHIIDKENSSTPVSNLQLAITEALKKV